MGCDPGYVSLPITSLFATASRPAESAPVCLPDTSNSCDDAFNCLSEFTFDWKIAGPAYLEGLALGASAIATQGLSIPFHVAAQAASLNEQPELAQAISIVEKLVTTDYSSLATLGEKTMGLFDDLSFDFGSVVDFTGDMLDNFTVSEFTDLASTGFQAYNLASGGGGVQTIPVMSKAPAVAGAIGGAVARTGAVVGRSFFNKWPNLATAIQKMRNAGQNVSRSKLYSMLKRFGPEFLVTAGIMSAAAVSELALAGPGHRRMNPANSKALRRAQRRLKSFHRLCSDSDVFKTRRRSCAKKC